MLWWVMTPEYQVVASDIVCVSPFQSQGLVLKNNWIVCSKYDYHPNLNSQDSWRGGRGARIQPFNVYESLHFYAEQDIKNELQK